MFTFCEVSVKYLNSSSSIYILLPFFGFFVRIMLRCSPNFFCRRNFFFCDFIVLQFPALLSLLISLLILFYLCSNTLEVASYSHIRFMYLKFKMTCFVYSAREINCSMRTSVHVSKFRFLKF